MTMLKEYPTKEQIQKITAFEDIEDFHGLMRYVNELWESFGEFGWKQDEDIYYLHTGGWSGNEDIISALEQNTMFWLIYWHQSTRGGHYIFCKSTFENLKKLNLL